MANIFNLSFLITVALCLSLSFGNNDPDNINPTATDTTESSNVVTDDETIVDNSADTTTLEDDSTTDDLTTDTDPTSIDSDSTSETNSTTDDSMLNTDTDSTSIDSDSTSDSTTSETNSTTDDSMLNTDTDSTSIDSDSTADAATDDNSSTEDSTTLTEPTTPPPKHLVETRLIWSSSDNQNDQTFSVRVDEGYISVTVQNVALTDDSYLLIATSCTIDGETEGRVFANKVKGPLSYLFYTNFICAVFTKASIDSEDENTNAFTVIFERFGDTSTTEPTTATTPINWPPTDTPDTVYITVYVTGKKLEDFGLENVNIFRNCVSLMAFDYCKEMQIQTTENITEKNVLISKLEQCPYSWSNRESCVQITFRLPIYYKPRDGYLLTTEHLEHMWLKYGETSQCFAENSLGVYQEPDVDRSIMWWAIGISLVILSFIILLSFLKICSRGQKSRSQYKNMNSSRSSSIISSRKTSILSLAPHYLQDHLDTPKFFET